MPLTKITRGALTADIIDSTKLEDNAVDTEHLANDAVESAEIGENITFTGKYIGLPVFANNTARDAAITSPAAGMMCFNTEQAAVQQYTGAVSGWSDIAPAPTFSSFGSGSAVNEDTNTTVTINGSQFASGMNVKLVDNSDDSDITGHTALSYTLVSSAQITVTVPAATTALTSGDVVYFTITKGGIGVNSSTLTVEADPVWVTNAGTLTTSPTTTYDNVSSGNIVTLSATSSTGAVTYTTSDLDSDFSLSSAGVISVASDIADVSGDFPTERTESFNVNAITDGIAEAATSRAFNIVVRASSGMPTGGTITTYGNYRVHSFTSTGNTTFTLSSTVSCDILLVAGGGGGGARHGGGGGGGGVIVHSGASLSAGSYTVTVGAGGVGGKISTGTRGTEPTDWDGRQVAGYQGGDSSIDSTYVAKGGGYGSGWASGVASSAGGSGAGGVGSSGGGGDHRSGGGTVSQTYPSGATAYGNAGGNGTGDGPHYGAGGGGAGGVGSNGANSANAGAGGAAHSNNYRTNSNIDYGGGGGGGSDAGDMPGGGTSGGDGSTGSAAGEDAPDNQGGGGGACRTQGLPGYAGNGGSGIVVIRYAY